MNNNYLSKSPEAYFFTFMLLMALEILHFLLVFFCSRER